VFIVGDRVITAGRINEPILGGFLLLWEMSPMRERSSWRGS
jgi:hypothetical protein